MHCPHNGPVRVSMDVFERVAKTALEEIPDEFQPYLENTVFIIEESSADGVMGLYEGATALGAGQGMPERVTIYKRQHELACSSFHELVKEVRRTILHEIGHHFGMEEDDLPF
jgi:predicted Zn-dependent protease with MMP-like domain